MRRVLAAFLVLVCCASLVGCGDGDGDDGETGSPSGSAAPATSGAVTLTEADGGGTRSLGVGDTVTISLEQCIGCGYSWRALAEPDDAVVELVEEGEVELEREDGAVGGMTRYEYTYEAVGEGRATIELGYVPPGRDEPEDEVTFTLVVEGD